MLHLFIHLSLQTPNSSEPKIFLWLLIMSFPKYHLLGILCCLVRLASFTYWCTFEILSCVFMAWYLISFFHWAIFHLIVVMTLTVYPFSPWSTSCLTLLSIMNKEPTDIRVRLLCVLKVSANLCLYQGAGLLDLPICMSMLRIHGKFLSSNVGIPISFPPPRNEDYQQLLIFTSVLCFEFI